MQVLRDQVQPLTLLARCNIFRPKTSVVLGKVLNDSSFVLESSRDAHSKRFVGRLIPGPDHTLIAYEWKQSLGHRLGLGNAAFDEDEILTFLHEWLRTETVQVE